MDDFKDAIFMYEPADLPVDLQVIESIAEEFELLPEARTTLVQKAHRLENAAPLIDGFKARTCGSPYSLAIINLNMFNTAELNFILRPDVLGDPRTIFLASLKYMVGEAYALSRDKSLRESANVNCSPSCIDCYGTHNRDAAYSRVSQLAAAYLREAELRTQAKRRGLVPAGEGYVSEALKKSQTTFFGRAMRSGLGTAVKVSGRMQPVGTAEAPGKPPSPPPASN